MIIASALGQAPRPGLKPKILAGGRLISGELRLLSVSTQVQYKRCRACQIDATPCKKSA
jgi:hypothetical protein